MKLPVSVWGDWIAETRTNYKLRVKEDRLRERERVKHGEVTAYVIPMDEQFRNAMRLDMDRVGDVEKGKMADSKAKGKNISNGAMSQNEQA
jgi:hypothetical protein